MRIYSAGTLAALAAGRLVERGLLLFDFPSGLYGFWTGAGPITIEGQTYTGAGSLIEVDSIGSSAGLSAVPLVLRLTAVPSSDLSPDVLASIEQEQYHQRPITISTAYFDPDTRGLIAVERVYRGYIDQITHQLQAGGGAVLEAHCESRSLDHARTGFRRRSDADQRRIDAADASFEHAAVVGSVDIYWGRNPAKKSGAGGDR